MLELLLWISPTGDFKPVGAHQSYAERVTGTHPGEADSNMAFNKMFAAGWIRGTVDNVNGVKVLFLNNSLDTHMTTLENLPVEQRRGIIDYAERHGLEIVNTQVKRISRSGEDVVKEETTKKSLTTPEFKKKLASLYSYLVKHLGIHQNPMVKLVNSKLNADKPFGLTGHYDHEKYLITLYITDRHDTDILRSFAHEVIHHWQQLTGTLHPEENPGATLPTSHHTEAHYAQNDLHLRKREMEAYLFGNILFRDWQDEQRHGPPSTPPVLPQRINENVTAHAGPPYYYRVHPKGDIWNVLKDGLWSYSPAEMPGSYVDYPERGRWSDQEFDDPQSYRFYVANSKWTMDDDRIRIRIPAEYLEGLEQDSLGDYYIDTGDSSEKILEPNQYDIQIGEKWIRADMADKIMTRVWQRKYKKPSGFYGNKYEEDPEPEEPEDT